MDIARVDTIDSRVALLYWPYRKRTIILRVNVGRKSADGFTDGQVIIYVESYLIIR